jgi:hypothetical protein
VGRAFGSAPSFNSRSKIVETQCSICNDESQILVRIPEKFYPLVTEPETEIHPEIPKTGYPITCACGWVQPEGKDFNGQFYLRAIYDVSSVLLGVASDQQWFNVLSACDDGYMSEESDSFAKANGLSSEFAPYLSIS